MIGKCCKRNGIKWNKDLQNSELNDGFTFRKYILYELKSNTHAFSFGFTGTLEHKSNCVADLVFYLLFLVNVFTVFLPKMKIWINVKTYFLIIPFMQIGGLRGYYFDSILIVWLLHVCSTSVYLPSSTILLCFPIKNLIFLLFFCNFFLYFFLFFSCLHHFLIFIVVS